MAKVEIDENEYAELKRVYGVAEVIGKNPKARALLQEAVAEAAPEQVGPEHRIRQEVNERLTGFEKKFDEFLTSQKTAKEESEAQAAQRALEGRWSASRRKAVDAGYTDEGLKELEDFMEHNGVADHELAMPAFERLHPPAEPVMTGSSRWNFFDRPQEGADPALDALMKGDDEGFLGRMIPAALKDARGH